MLEITAIKPQKKEGRFNIYLDGKFAFGIDEETLVREKLEVGRKVTSSYIHKLVYGATVEKLADKALRFLSYRPRSEKEIRDHLWRKIKSPKGKGRALKSPGLGSKMSSEPSPKSLALGNSGSLIDDVIDKLKDLGYIDDTAFASWWLEQRIRFKPRGKMLLRSELLAKGIDRDLVEEELSKYSAEEELSWAKRVVEKKIPQYKNLDPKERREKLSSYLARRGFSWEVIEQALVD